MFYFQGYWLRLIVRTKLPVVYPFSRFCAYKSKNVGFQFPLETPTFPKDFINKFVVLWNGGVFIA